MPVDLFAYRADALEKQSWNLEHRGFCFVAIRHEAFVKIGTRAGDIGKAASDETARERLGDSDALFLRDKKLPNDFLELLFALTEKVIAEKRA